jgi:hypothetical protein
MPCLDSAPRCHGRFVCLVLAFLLGLVVLSLGEILGPLVGTQVIQYFGFNAAMITWAVTCVLLALLLYAHAHVLDVNTCAEVCVTVTVSVGDEALSLLFSVFLDLGMAIFFLFMVLLWANRVCVRVSTRVRFMTKCTGLLVWPQQEKKDSYLL